MSNYYTNELDQAYFTTTTLSSLNTCAETPEQSFEYSKVNLEALGFMEETPSKATCLDFDLFESILAQDFKPSWFSDYPFELSLNDCPSDPTSDNIQSFKECCSSAGSNLSKRKPLDSPRSVTTDYSEHQSTSSSFSSNPEESVSSRNKIISIMQKLIDRVETPSHLLKSIDTH